METNREKALKILSETDPFLREIWDAGYDYIMEDHPFQKIKLIRKSDGYIKIIPMYESNTTHNYTIKVALLYNGETYRWISESDGSAEKFRNLICPEN